MRKTMMVVSALLALSGCNTMSAYEQKVADRNAAKWKAYEDAGWCVPKIGTFPLDKPGCVPLPYRGGVYAIDMGETPVEYAMRSSGIRTKAPLAQMKAHQNALQAIIRANPNYKPPLSFGGRFGGGSLIRPH